MRLGDYISSSWLKPEDLGGKKRIVTITKISEHENQKGEKQAVLHFKETQKKLGVNGINGRTIKGLTGTDEMLDWVGHKIALYTTEIEVKGERKLAIRVDPKFHEAPARAAAAASRSSAFDDGGPDDEPSEIEQPNDDEIPF